MAEDLPTLEKRRTIYVTLAVLLLVVTWSAFFNALHTVIRYPEVDTRMRAFYTAHCLVSATTGFVVALIVRILANRSPYRQDRRGFARLFVVGAIYTCALITTAFMIVRSIMLQIVDSSVGSDSGYHIGNSCAYVLEALMILNMLCMIIVSDAWHRTSLSAVLTRWPRSEIFEMTGR